MHLRSFSNDDLALDRFLATFYGEFGHVLNKSVSELDIERHHRALRDGAVPPKLLHRPRCHLAAAVLASARFSLRIRVTIAVLVLDLAPVL